MSDSAAEIMEAFRQARWKKYTHYNQQYHAAYYKRNKHECACGASIAKNSKRCVTCHNRWIAEQKRERRECA